MRTKAIDYFNSQNPLCSLASRIALHARCGLYASRVALAGADMLVHMRAQSEMRYSEPLHPWLAIILMAAGKEGCDWYPPAHSLTLLSSPRLSELGKSMAVRVLAAV